MPSHLNDRNVIRRGTGRPERGGYAVSIRRNGGAGGGSGRNGGNGLLVRRFGISARRNVPLFRRIAASRVYAARIVRAIEARNYEQLSRIIRETAPGASVGLGAGFDSNFDFSNPGQTYGFGIFRPGRTVTTAGIRGVARVMLPVIRRLATSLSFRREVVRLFRANNEAELLRLLRRAAGTSRFLSLTIDQFGFAAVVRLPGEARYNAIFSIMV